ncbi:Sec-independent protein translocase subunit TatA [Pseudonocardia dioxanivorans]|uniref:Sec-independent protein translocase subunit TatA n=1 Tax=Pseudonocardia dioxanivorans TaxID=240495 RepID=UPI0002F79F7A|nr:Sec-independent protein translocase subunit TatA [Pseudonocardia dioxanivorans]
MGALSPTHWLIIVGVVALLFGAKRLPEAARGLGRSALILKAEMRETETSSSSAHPAPPVSAATTAPVTDATTAASGKAIGPADAR